MHVERPDYGVLVEILEDMNTEGGYTASILARDDGLLMASAASPTTNREVVAAMSGYVASSVERMRDELGLGQLKDISVRCSEGKAVFRMIFSDVDHGLILAALMPRKIRYHNRALGKAATKIRNLLAQKSKRSK
jgi:predicted regulator of Ras-like GTPase activity (Roadblock/LC7/MglB family)